MKYLVIFILLLFNTVLQAQSINIKDNNYSLHTERDSVIENQVNEPHDYNARDTSYRVRSPKYLLFIKPLIGGDDAERSFNINLTSSQSSVVSYDLAPVHIGITLGYVLGHFNKSMPDQNKTCIWEFPESCFMAYSYAPNRVEHYVSIHYIYYDGSTDKMDKKDFKIKTNDIELDGVGFNRIVYECNEIGADYGVNLFGFFITLGLSYKNEKNTISFSVPNSDKKDYVVEKNGYKSVVFKYGIDCNWVYIQGQYIFHKHNQFYKTQSAISIGTGFPIWFLRKE